MISFNRLGHQAAGVPVLADDLVEFHAARLLLLFKVCGKKGRIDGLTKMAKLDFFVRYPQFFADACAKLGLDSGSAPKSVESSMVRFHYGPWDKRYYQALAYIEGRGLIKAWQEGNSFRLALTDAGREVAERLANEEVFDELCEHMRRVKTALGDKSGTSLKKLVYDLFDEEVAKLPLGEVINP